MMELPLVVGADGSQSSLRAVDWAVDEAARHGLALRLLYASLWERYEGSRPAFSTERPSEEVMAERIAASCAERAERRNPEVKVSAEVLPDEAAHALVRASQDAFAVVVGCRGRGEVARMLLGSVSLAVAARAVSPVVVIRGPERNRDGRLGRVVVGVGDSPQAEAAVGFAFREAQARGCALLAVRAWRRPAHGHRDSPLVADDAGTAHEEKAAIALTEALREAERRHPRVQVHRRTVQGPAHKVVLDAAADADLLVVGAQRNPGHHGLQLGRVAHAALHHADCPVAVIPQRS
jgi:nucleotide-binding universal stress UspA family protein